VKTRWRKVDGRAEIEMMAGKLNNWTGPVEQEEGRERSGNESVFADNNGLLAV
jgi:hypothetical protein